MAAAPVVPASPAPPPGNPPLSQGARIVDTFIAPSKTFTDLRRSAQWWAPFLLMVIVSSTLVYTAGQKIGFRKLMENQMASQPKAQARLENLPADQREAQLVQGAKVTAIISYCFPVLVLFIWAIITLLMWATLKVAAGSDISFSATLAIIVYAGLPLTLKSVLAIISVLAGMSPESFSFQNPVATNPGYFLNPADGVLIYSLATAVDLFMIWTLVLTAIGFIYVGKVKPATAYAVSFGWWAVLTLASSAMGAAFS